jgi:hypothetical protein
VVAGWNWGRFRRSFAQLDSAAGLYILIDCVVWLSVQWRCSPGVAQNGTLWLVFSRRSSSRSRTNGADLDREARESYLLGLYDAFALDIAGNGRFVMLSDSEVVREVLRGSLPGHAV